MWHTCAYGGATVSGGSTAAADNAITDNVFKIGSANGFVLQEDMMLLWAGVYPVAATAARLSSPKLAQFGYLQLTPLQNANKNANGLLIASWPYRPFTFRNQEEVTCLVDTGGTVATTEVVVCSFSNGIDQVPQGEELTFKATSTTAAVANSWTTLTYTMSQTLPEGAYAMLASEVQSTNAIAHRWTFWGQFYRPGMPSTTSYTNVQQYPGARDYRNGLMGKFSNVTLPNLEVLCNTTDNSHTIIMHAIKVA